MILLKKELNEITGGEEEQAGLECETCHSAEAQYFKFVYKDKSGHLQSISRQLCASCALEQKRKISAAGFIPIQTRRGL